MAEQVVYDLVLKPPRRGDQLLCRQIDISVNGGPPAQITVAMDAPKAGPLACPAGAVVRHEIRNRHTDGRLSEAAVLEVVMQPDAAPVEVPGVPTVEYAVVPQSPAGSSA